MKFKNKLGINNIVYLLFIIIVSSIIVGAWLYFEENVYAIIFGVISLLFIIIYLRVSYEICDDYLIVKYNFVKLKFEYKSITSFVTNKNNITINFKNIGFHINTNNNDLFISEIKKKMSEATK